MNDEGRRLAAIMFTDMVGYTALTQSDEVLALALLEEHRKLLREVLSRHRGAEIKTMGDAFLVEFRSALDAVKCAMEIQEGIGRRNAEVVPAKRFQVRIGIHAGDVVGVDGDIYGDTVNLASRIESVADPGCIVVSSQVYEAVRNKVNLGVERLGEHRLKNVEGPILLYGVRAFTAPDRAEREVTKQTPGLRMAVLPFTNISSDPGDEYIADGLSEELISAFSKVPQLKVVPKSSVMRFKGRDSSPSQIGRELGVNALMEGSVRKNASRLRVTVRVIDTGREEYLWSHNYDSGVEDILSVQQDIAEKTAGALRSVFWPSESGGERPKTVTTNPKAFLLYLRGRYHMMRYSESEVREAAELFRRAIELDDGFAAAYTVRAQCFMLLGYLGLIPSVEGFDEARPLLAKAVEIDEGLDIAHMLMGRLMMDQDWDWKGAEEEFRRAVQISPNSAEAHYRYALLLNTLARNDEALGEVAKAEELDPLSVAVNQTAGTILYFAGRSKDAIERLERAIEIDPRAAFAHNNLGLAMCHEGMVEAGIAEIRKALELDPNNMMFRSDLCYAYARSGMKQEAMDVLRSAQESVDKVHVPPVALAGMHAALGEDDQALIWLQKAFDERSPYLGSLKIEKCFDGMRSDSRFVALIRGVGLD